MTARRETSAAGSIAAPWWTDDPGPPASQTSRRDRPSGPNGGNGADRPEDETAVGPDEVASHTNPPIGRLGMIPGPPAAGATPGPPKQRHRSGSIPWRTGPVFVTAAAPQHGRPGARFLKHRDDRRRQRRRDGTIPVLCDNAGGHPSREVIPYLGKGAGRIEVPLLPSYSPDRNPIERVWWHGHEHITRNHRCKDLGQ